MKAYQIIETTNSNLPIDNKVYLNYSSLQNKIKELEREDVGFPRKFIHKELEVIE